MDCSSGPQVCSCPTQRGRCPGPACLHTWRWCPWPRGPWWPQGTWVSSRQPREHMARTQRHTASLRCHRGSLPMQPAKLCAYSLCTAASYVVAPMCALDILSYAWCRGCSARVPQLYAVEGLGVATNAAVSNTALKLAQVKKHPSSRCFLQPFHHRRQSQRKPVTFASERQAASLTWFLASMQLLVLGRSGYPL